MHSNVNPSPLHLSLILYHLRSKFQNNFNYRFSDYFVLWLSTKNRFAWNFTNIAKRKTLAYYWQATRPYISSSSHCAGSQGKLLRMGWCISQSEVHSDWNSSVPGRCWHSVFPHIHMDVLTLKKKWQSLTGVALLIVLQWNVLLEKSVRVAHITGSRAWGYNLNWPDQ